MENADSSSHSSSPHMRRSPSIQRSSISPSISRHHELGANGGIRPKPQTPEVAPRRAELSIGINAKAADTSPRYECILFPQLHPRLVTVAKQIKLMANGGSELKSKRRKLESSFRHRS